MPLANPGAVADVAGSGSIASNWGNAIRDRVVGNYATLAALNAAVPSPIEGMVAYIGGVVHTFVVYAGATDTWRPPWNIPWGRITQATKTAAQNGFSTIVDVSSLTVTATAIAYRLWRVSLYIPSITQLTGGATVTLEIQTLASGAGTRIQAGINSLVTNGICEMGMVAADITTVAGSTSFHARIATSANTANITCAATSPGILTIDDMGPSGAPA